MYMTENSPTALVCTGITLAMHYNANILNVFDSIEHIMLS